MIISRFIEHVKKQHWTGAFIELGIVILGVFIGLQVNNWNTARHDKALEMQYLKRLRDDFQVSIQSSKANISMMSVEFRTAGDMLRDLAACHLDPAERHRFSTGIYLLGKFGPSPLNRGTIDELRSTGRLVLLRDVRLRKKLADTLQLARFNDGVLQMITSRATPLDVYIYQRAVFRQPKGGLQFKDALLNGVPPGSIEFDFPALCKDPRYVGSISALQQFTHTLISHNQEALADYRAMVQVIDHDLRLGK